MTPDELIFIVIMFIVLLVLLFRVLTRPPPPTGLISGGLTDVSGAPVAGATVTLYAADKITEIAIVTSDATGKYTLPAEPLGDYHITAILNNTDGTWLQATRTLPFQHPRWLWT